MYLKLQSGIIGKSGIDIIEAIVKGERDPEGLAQLRCVGIKADEATIARSLRGHWQEEHILEANQALLPSAVGSLKLNWAGSTTAATVSF